MNSHCISEMSKPHPCSMGTELVGETGPIYTSFQPPIAYVIIESATHTIHFQRLIVFHLLPLYSAPCGQLGRTIFIGGSPHPASASRNIWTSTVLCEAEQRFLLLFPEKEEYYLTPGLLNRPMVHWGLAPKPPWFRFAEDLGFNCLLRSRTTLFASFSGKRRTSLPDELSRNITTGFKPRIHRDAGVGGVVENHVTWLKLIGGGRRVSQRQDVAQL
jgi:hypothetical protein